jgi:gluconolactonase
LFGSKVTLLILAAMFVLYWWSPQMRARSSFGRVLRIEPLLMDLLIEPNATIEVLGGGYEWTEGPCFVPSKQMLLFSDVKRNIIYQWGPASVDRTGASTKPFLRQSGLLAKSSPLQEPGSNGLVLEPFSGNLFVCDHGNRRVYRLEKDNRTRVAVATHYDGRRLNSPNDLVFDRDGNLLFTDPSYGLRRKKSRTEPEQSPDRELTFNGVYRIRREYLFRNLNEDELKRAAHVELLTDEIARPNGIAFSPDYRRLYISNSNGSDPSWLVYDVSDDDVE